MEGKRKEARVKGFPFFSSNVPRKRKFPNRDRAPRLTSAKAYQKESHVQKIAERLRKREIREALTKTIGGVQVPSMSASSGDGAVESNCPVCFEAVESPWRLSCSHKLCRPCLDKLFFHRRLGRAPACPLCRKGQTEYSVTDSDGETLRPREHLLDGRQRTFVLAEGTSYAFPKCELRFEACSTVEELNAGAFTLFLKNEEDETVVFKECECELEMLLMPPVSRCALPALSRFRASL